MTTDAIGNALGGGGGSGDTTPPTVSVISPTPGVAPGQPGGFPASRVAAETTPIVLRVIDVAPGVEYICIMAEYPGLNPEMVFRRGAFRAPYLASTFTSSGTQVDMTVVRDGGWPRAAPGNSSYIKFSVDAIDFDGNIDGGVP